MPQPEWAAVTGPDELQRFLDAHDGRAVVKTPRGGYDGKGVRVVSHEHDVDDWFQALAEDDAPRGVEAVGRGRRGVADVVMPALFLIAEPAVEKLVVAVVPGFQIAQPEVVHRGVESRAPQLPELGLHAVPQLLRRQRQPGVHREAAVGRGPGLQRAGEDGRPPEDAQRVAPSTFSTR